MDACTNKAFLLVSGFIDLGVKSVGYGAFQTKRGGIFIDCVGKGIRGFRSFETISVDGSFKRVRH